MRAATVFLGIAAALPRVTLAQQMFPNTTRSWIGDHPWCALLPILQASIIKATLPSGTKSARVRCQG